MSIRISHEVPLEILRESRKFNDYEYCLGHLNRVYPEYKKFYQESVELGRIVYLDNGCFELGKPIDNDWLIEEVKFINPTHVIAPDFIDEKNRTIETTKQFMEQLAGIEYKGKMIAVVQGRTYEEYVECYRWFDSHLGVDDWLAFPFDIKCFHEQALERGVETDTQIYALSRTILLEKLIEDKVINYGRNHHLLGCSDPVEFREYTVVYKEKYKFVKSVDTSCPIVLAMFQENLKEGGLGKEKRKEKLADNLFYKFSKSHKLLMYDNIKIFREYYLGR